MSESQPNLELEVTNFGPIKEARIDLRPLTVFVGPSNAGKSYLVTLIYALNKCFRKNRDDDYRGHFPSRYHNTKLRRSEPKELIKWLNSQLEGKKKSQSVILPKAAQPIMKEWFEENTLLFMHQIERCFGTSIEELKRKGSRGAFKIGVNYEASVGNEENSTGLCFDLSDQKLTFEIPNQVYLTVSESKRLRYLCDFLEERMSERPREDIALEVQTLLTEIINRNMTQGFNNSAYYLPAGRAEIMRTYYALLSALINTATIARAHSSNGAQTLSGVTADFLDQLVTMEQISSSLGMKRGGIRKASDFDYVDEIQRRILNGEIILKQNQHTRLNSFEYKPDGWKKGIPLQQTSSTVSEIAPLVLYLKHVVFTGDLLIIDEPESHLHPAKQVELMDQLAKVVESGVRVILTTHSQWILEELANLVLSAQLKDKGENEKRLSTGTVGVWLFPKKPKSQGVEVKEIRPDVTGLYPTNFDEVAMAVYNDWARIESEISKVKEKNL